MDVRESRWYMRRYNDDKMQDEILFLSAHKIDVTNPAHCPSSRWRDWQDRKRAEVKKTAHRVPEEPDAAVMEIITKTIQENLRKRGRSGPTT